MMDFLNHLLDISQIPVFTAFILGIMTAISPCPLATNFTAVAYIGRNIEDRRKTFLAGILYSLGRMVAYTMLGAIIISFIRNGNDVYNFQLLIYEFGRIVGPLLIAAGLFMLFGHRLNLPKFGYNGNYEPNKNKGLWGAFLLGVLFAMSFCPISGMFYFGMLIPMSVSANNGYLLPIVFAIATALPVVLIAWIIVFSVQNIRMFMEDVKIFQKWLNRIVAAIFIIVGMYYTITILI